MKLCCIALPMIAAFCLITKIAADNDSELLNEDIKDWNTVVDALVGPLTADIRKSIPEVIRIPGIHEPFSEKIWFLLFEGFVNINGGTLEDLKSIERGGEALFWTNGTSYLLTCPLKVKVTQFQYQNFMASVGKLQFHGTMKGTVGTFTVNLTIHVSVDEDKKCSATFCNEEIMKYEDVQLYVTGFGPMNNLGSQVANSQLSKNKKKITDMFEATIIGAMTKEMNHWTGRFTLEEIVAYIQAQIG